MRKMTILLLAGQLFLSGCLQTYFSMINNKYVFKSRRIAVISGLDNEMSVFLAAELSKELAAKTTFNVMSADEIGKSVPGYPVKIRGPYTSAFFSIDDDYSKTDIIRIEKIKSKLDVDYLYILWAPIVVQKSVNIQIHIITQLFEFPSFSEVAHARYYIMFATKNEIKDEIKKEVKKTRNQSCLSPTIINYIAYERKDAISAGGEENMKYAVKEATEKAVQAIIKATGKGKPGFEHGSERNL